MIVLMLYTSNALPKQRPSLSKGITFAKLMTPPTMHQMGRFPIFKVVEKVTHRGKVAAGDGTVVRESVQWDLLMLEGIDMIQTSTSKAKAG